MDPTPSKDRPHVIQCSTGPFWAFELEHAMDCLAEAGFESMELMVTRDPSTQEPDLPLRLASERGLRIGSVHGPFLVISKTVWGINSMDKVKRGVELCRALGASTYVVHPPYLWEREFARWIKYESAEYSAEHGVTVAVETMYPKWTAGRRLRMYRWLRPDELLAGAPHVVLDTSHLALCREDILGALKMLMPKLVHVHLSDNAGDGRDGHLELEQGILPVDRFLSELRRQGYAGDVSLELSVRKYIERPEALVSMLRRNRVYVEDRLSKDGRVQKGLPREARG
ncbi:MAG: sugar phosphate isomerase/epimerase family protein [Actinomycetota bacterium]